jgi:hypothetical protein
MKNKPFTAIPVCPWDLAKIFAGREYCVERQVGKSKSRKAFQRQGFANKISSYSEARFTLSDLTQKEADHAAMSQSSGTAL